MRRYSLVLVVLVFLALPLAVMGQDDQTIVIRGFGNITNFNPILTNDGASAQAYNLLWPLPFETDSFTGEPVPGLTTWTVSEDGLTYTFTILEDAVWSDGTPITSADMKWVIDAVKSDTVESVLKPYADPIAEVNIIDDKTYEVVMVENNCAALSDIGNFRFMPSFRFAEDFSDLATNELTTNPDISGGPYILEEWRPDEFQRFNANPTYWEGEPNIPVLINRVIGEQAVAVQALQAGEIDYSYMQGDLFGQIADTSNLQFQAFPQITVNFFSMNWADATTPSAAYDEDGNSIEQTPHPIFSDVRVRQAVAMGYNKQDILNTLGENGGTRLIGVVAPSITWAYNSDLESWPYDPEAAADLLEEAGWVDSDGDGIREKDGVQLAFTINYSDILLFFETTALVIQDQLGQIGFDVTLNKQEWADYISTTYYGQNYDATPMSNSGGSGGPPDPNEFTSLLLSQQDVPGGGGNNIASYINPEVDELIQEARSVPGCALEDRAEIYAQIQQITHDDVAYDWTFTPNLYQIMNSRIGNFNPGPTWVFYGYTAHVEEWTIGE
jgi:peptide/nickel transport system substrate-binding protein